MRIYRCDYLSTLQTQLYLECPLHVFLAPRPHDAAAAGTGRPAGGVQVLPVEVGIRALAVPTQESELGS